MEYDEAWKLLVEVRLAAQCTDARVNIVVQDLYAKYPTVAALAEAKPRCESNRASVWTWKKQGEGYLRMHEGVAREISGQCTG